MERFDTPSLLQAITDLDNANYLSAFAALTELAEGGNPKAQCNLASMLQCGLGIKTDGQRAVRLYLEVAKQNIRDELLSGDSGRCRSAFRDHADHSFRLMAIGIPG